MDVTALMEKAIGQQAADLHLQTGRPPMLRLAQGLCSFPGPPLSEDDVRCLLHAVGWTRDEVGDGAFSGAGPCAAASMSAGNTPASTRRYASSIPWRPCRRMATGPCWSASAG